MKTSGSVELSLHEARLEHRRLGEEIAEHDQRYYQDDAPTISDARYDELRQRYEFLEKIIPRSHIPAVAHAEGGGKAKRKIF